MSASLTVAMHALREARRRRVLVVVLALTAAVGVLYLWGADELFQTVAEPSLSGAVTGTFVDQRTLAGATMVGLAIFGALFLAAVLVTFLVAGAVQGDAEQGLLQPLLVRRLSRPQYLLGRYLAAVITASLYVVTVYLGAVLIIGLVGDWWPSDIAAVALRLVLAVAALGALATLGSVRLGATANGIFILMVYGAGLVSGLMGSIGDSVGSQRLQTIADVTSWVLPFQGLYRDGLARLVSEVEGPAGFLLQLGPLGSSSDAGPLLVPWTLAFSGLALAAAALAFGRRDL